MKLTHVSLYFCATLALAPMALAHEFWIEPTEFQVQKDTAIEANLKNGQLFEGTRQSYFENRNTFFEAIMGEDVTPITGRMGDRPAIQLPPIGKEGLLILAHEATPSILTYIQWEKFLKFVDHKDFTDALEIHEARGWSNERFRESYTRHSKSLVAVGHGEGSDREIGLATEFVAMDNPYAQGFDGTLDVTLLYDGAPRGDAQVEVYARDTDDTVTVTIQRTDADGHAAIMVKPGFKYMLDAVVLRPISDAPVPEGEPVWETLWASMTFAVPAR